MNRQLRFLVRDHGFESNDYQKERLSFGMTCINRITHLLIDERLIKILDDTQLFLAGELSQTVFDKHIQEAQQIAQSQAGTNGIDGGGNAAVSATFAVARALSGDAINAAEYAAYAAVYSYASHTVTDPAAYEKEYQWQVDAFEKMLQEHRITAIKS